MQRDLVAGLLLEFRHHRSHHLGDRAGVQHLDLYPTHAVPAPELPCRLNVRPCRRPAPTATPFWLPRRTNARPPPILLNCSGIREVLGAESRECARLHAATVVDHRIEDDV